MNDHQNRDVPHGGMNKKVINQALRLLKAEQKKLAASRDALRAVRDEIEEFESAASDSLLYLEQAIDRLSELV